MNLLAVMNFEGFYSVRSDGFYDGWYGSFLPGGKYGIETLQYNGTKS